MVARTKKEQNKPAKAKATAKTKAAKNAPKKINKRKHESDGAEYEDLGHFDTWDWSAVTAPTSTTISDDTCGFLCLEEIDDVDVEYVNGVDGSKIAKFKRKKDPHRKQAKEADPGKPLDLGEMEDYYDVDTFDENLVAASTAGKKETVPEPAKNNLSEQTKKKKVKKSNISKKPKKTVTDDVSQEEDEPKETKAGKSRISVDDVDQSFDVSAWDSFKLSDDIMNALKYYKFSKPTPIQSNALPLALNGRDVIGSAETGSGKTLAFGIPIVQYIQAHREETADSLTGLILTPTRELAIQVQNHIQNMATFTDIRVVSIVGGMSVQKQQRQLKRNPDIIVATPGRFWELFSENDAYMDMMKGIKYLVLDEADRMLEKGHFGELTNILNAISEKRQDTTEWPEESEEAKRRIVKRDIQHHQTFIYTATLNQELRFHVKAKKGVIRKATGTLEDLLANIEFADPDPATVDMTTDNIVASRLEEAKIDCLDTEKDLYVYYFVSRYPGRTIIFVNSIDAIRRLVPVFKLLNVEVLGLHAQMQQRQRLKNIDRFKENERAVLVASDVAARGLDIPLVEHVIHYQLPRSGEIYVHRSGRTARADRDGISLLLTGPKETKVYNTLCKTLRKGKAYADFPVDQGTLTQLKKRVQLAVEIDKLLHSEKKATHEDNWLRNLAKEMDVEVDEDTLGGKGKGSDDDRDRTRSKVRSLQAQLNELLTKSIMPRGTSSKYLTGGVIPDLVERLQSSSRSLLRGHDTSKAVEDLQKGKKKRRTK